MKGKPWFAHPIPRMLFAGLVIYGTWSWLGAEEAETIRISRDEVAALSSGLERRLGRAPTPDEITAAIDERVDEEVLYREALRHGLQLGDPIVRRRLVQKMSFVLESLDAPPAATEADLRAWMAAHPERYQRSARIDLSHVFAEDEGAVAGLRAALEQGADPATLGRPFPHPRVLLERDEGALGRMFGERFAEGVLALREPGWHGLESTFGWHLVRVDARHEAAPLTLESARARVLEELGREEERKALTQGVAKRRAGYRIEVER